MNNIYFEAPVSFDVRWELGNACNYNCHYCMQNKDKKKKEEKIIEEAGMIYGKVRMIGGEPSIYDLPKILENVNWNKVEKLQIMTNFSAPLEYWQKVIKYPKVELSCSLHLDYVGQEFIDKAVALNAGDRLFITVVVDDSNVEQYKKLDFKNIRVGARLRRENGIPVKVSEDTRNWVNEHSTPSFYSRFLDEEKGFIGFGKYCEGVRTLEDGIFWTHGCWEGRTSKDEKDTTVLCQNKCGCPLCFARKVFD